MTVDSGSLWVAEKSQAGNRTDRFDASSGAFVSQLAPPGPSFESFYSGIAVGHATGETELYLGSDTRTVEGELQGAIVVYDGAGKPQSTWSGADTPRGSFSCFGCTIARTIAVDNSASLGDWAAGDVFVLSPLHIGQTEGVVDVFKPEAKRRREICTCPTANRPQTGGSLPRIA